MTEPSSAVWFPATMNSITQKNKREREKTISALRNGAQFLGLGTFWQNTFLQGPVHFFIVFWGHALKWYFKQGLFWKKEKKKRFLIISITSCCVPRQPTRSVVLAQPASARASSNPGLSLSIIKWSRCLLHANVRGLRRWPLGYSKEGSLAL